MSTAIPPGCVWRQLTSSWSPDPSGLHDMVHPLRNGNWDRPRSKIYNCPVVVMLYSVVPLCTHNVVRLLRSERKACPVMVGMRVLKDRSAHFSYFCILYMLSQNFTSVKLGNITAKPIPIIPIPSGKSQPGPLRYNH